MHGCDFCELCHHVRRWRRTGRRQFYSPRRATDRLDESLKIPTPSHGQPASSTAGLNPISVRCAFGHEQRDTGCGAALCRTELKAEIAFQDMKDLVLGPMYMQRWRITVWGTMLQDGDPVSPVAGTNLYSHQRVEKPPIGATIG